MVTDVQVRKLMTEFSKHGQIGRAAACSWMNRKTARKYLKAFRLPSEMKSQKRWRNRPDAFAEDWPWIVDFLKAAPELEAKSLFEHLMEQRPGAYRGHELRTLQRRIKDWRAQEGPEKELFFPQAHIPGEAMQTDFTWGTELDVTIQGEAFPHLLCHSVLPYSNWEWVTVCRSESMLAIKRGVQSALFRLGRRPRFHQTDNSTSATHQVGPDHREFNDDYLALMRHLGMTPRTTEVGAKEQNGDIEAANGAFKRRVRQHLILRGNRDFESIEALEDWLQGVAERANRLRVGRFEEEWGQMALLEAVPYPEYDEVDARVTDWSTVRVKANAYSVPSRLRGEKVRVRVFEDRVMVYHRGFLQLETPRLMGDHGCRIDYRHVIWSLVQKPGAFARFRYRQEMFPTLTFRLAYDALSRDLEGWKADREYLQILHLAAQTLESGVETILKTFLEGQRAPRFEAVEALVKGPKEPPETPAIPPLEPTLDAYDRLLGVS